MRRLNVLIVSTAVAAAVVWAAPASAAPSNKNTEVIQVNCDGRALTVTAVHKKNEGADLVSAGALVGGGAATVASLTAFESGTTNVIFSAESHYGGPVNAECSGTATEDGQTFDFVVEAHLVGAHRGG